MIRAKFYNVLELPIPASSSPWSSNVGATVQLVYYAGNETNGAYYTWCAATVNYGRYCEGATTIDNNSAYSICPKGWKLPTNTEYGTLLSSANITDDNAGSNKMRGVPYNFLSSGIVGNFALQGIGYVGTYWSSTTNGGTDAYRLYLASAAHMTSDGRYDGCTVRCIAL